MFMLDVNSSLKTFYKEYVFELIDTHFRDTYLKNIRNQHCRRSSEIFLLALILVATYVSTPNQSLTGVNTIEIYKYTVSLN